LGRLPPTAALTMQALPSNEGTTDPAPGNSTEDLNSVVSIQALPNSGYHFTSWTGNVAQPSNPSTTVTMSQAQTVTANFDVGAPSADLQVTVNDGKSAAIAGAKNTYTIVVSNAGPSYVTGAVLKDTFPSIFTGVTCSAAQTGGATGFTVNGTGHIKNMVTNAGPSKVSGAVIRDTFPSTFTGVTYTATQSGGASGFSASGTGNINNTVMMPAGSKITYKATGTISASATGSISNTATVTAPAGVTDPNTANNSATDTDAL